MEFKAPRWAGVINKWIDRLDRQIMDQMSKQIDSAPTTEGEDIGL